MLPIILKQVYLSPPATNFKGTFAIFPQGYFIMTPPVYENLEKYPTIPLPRHPLKCLFDPLLQLNTKEYLI